MPVCEFCPGNGGPIVCKQNSLVSRMSRETELPPADVKVMVCEQGTVGQRALDCTGFNNLVVYGSQSSYAALDPRRLPG